MSNTHSFTEEIQISADKLVDTVKDLVHEGNVRHIVIRNEKAETVLEIPVTIGIVGVVIAPILAAVAAIAVVAADYTIVVTREADAPPVATPTETTPPETTPPADPS